MFDWRDFFITLFGLSIALLVVFLLVLLLAFVGHLMSEVGNAWGVAIVVGVIVVCGSVASGFGW